jgi:hypothetical protein
MTHDIPDMPSGTPPPDSERAWRAEVLRDADVTVGRAQHTDESAEETARIVNEFALFGLSGRR